MARFAQSMAPLILGFDPRAGAEVAARFADLPEAQFLGEVAGGAPYLRGLMLREEGFLRAALTAEVAEVVPAEIALLRDLPLDALARDLRRAKRRVALWTGLCDLGGVWDLEAVTGALTDLADACVAVCVQRLVEDEVRRGKLPDAAGAGGMVVLAMGK
ncbi:MAG: glutamine-synthetase adenylyltransferase, partial [Candidatus Saccharibacteria bacterium]|nr:glutamine-synthetase adenylyltransferase [Pseudorhodobacter sp.]